MSGLLFAVFLGLSHHGAFDPVTNVVAHEPTVVMISLRNNFDCALWRAVSEHILRNRGWEIREVYHVRAREYPSFRIYFAGKWYTHEGFMYMSRLRLITGLPVI